MKVETISSGTIITTEGTIDHKSQVKTNEAVEHKENISEEKVDKIVKKLNENVDTMSTGIKFEKDNDLGKWIVKVYDDKGVMIRQIPTKEVIELSKSMEDVMGMIFNKTV